MEETFVIMSNLKITNLWKCNKFLCFESNSFLMRNQTQGPGFKILTPKQMLPRLPISFVQKVQKVNYLFFVSSKEITKKVYSNIIN